MRAADDPHPAADRDDSGVLRAVEQYLAAMQAGRRPDRAAFLAAHPELAGPLAECLAALEFVQAAASSLADASKPRPSTAGLPDLDAPLGDFRIVREVGRGGMGVVYEAEQLSLGRRIALKVLPLAMTLDPRHLQRFKNEAQAAAQLHHPNIVPVFAVGEDRGVHFYAMQFIDGRTLAAVVAELRRRKGEPLRPDDATTEPVGRTAPQGLEPVLAADSGLISSFALRDGSFARTVARIGVQAAEALHYAHQMGVVHRDVKPGNLMVDGRGHLWVTDFGLARCQSDTGLTEPGDVLGTLRYMPPEQALSGATVDHRADVYALGATLYELLTLETPFPGRDRRELLRQIEHDEPRPLRRVSPDVPADLETVVLKALAKNPQERYATAQELADDLRRVLEDRPVRARRPGLLEHAGRWARRNTGPVCVAVVALLLSVAGLATTTLLVARAQMRTQAACMAEAAQRTQAEESFRQARDAVDFFTRVSSEELPDRPELLEVRRKLLNGALEYYRVLIDRRRDDPATQSELAVRQFRVAALLDRLGAQAETEKSVRENWMQPKPPHASPPGFADSARGYLPQESLAGDSGLSSGR